MLRGIYAAATGMVAQTKKIDGLGNNVANANTPGFKRDEVSFKAYNDQSLTDISNGKKIGNASFGVWDDEVNTDVSQGALEQTNLKTDVAITSDGYFSVASTKGTEYTRNGNFNVDAQGYLSLTTGQRLIGQNGAIHVGGDNFQVATDGTILQNGNAVDKIQLYSSPAPQNISKQADGLFAIVGATTITGTLKQGYIENSNVDVTSEMTQLMSASRSFQSCQQSFKTMDQTTQQLNQIASLR
jgi:flagellar basal-body rod protein FlgF